MLSASSKYALRALLCLSEENCHDFMRVDELSRKADVPGPYLSKIMKILAQKKIVLTRRGLSGGVKLAPNARHLTFYDVCAALEDPIVNQSCILSKKACGGPHPCALHYEWAKIRERFHTFLKKAKIE